MKTVGPLALIDVLETGGGAPSTWSARTIDDRPVAVRFRHGELTVRIGHVGGSIENAKAGEEWFSGLMSVRPESYAAWEDVARWANLSNVGFA